MPEITPAWILAVLSIATISGGMLIGFVKYRLSDDFAKKADVTGVGASVAVSGVIGFVGLIVPHIMRTLIGERPSALLLPSALGGAILTLTADALVRLTPGVGEVRLGIAMALIGAPTFLWMMLRLRRGRP